MHITGKVFLSAFFFLLILSLGAQDIKLPSPRTSGGMSLMEALSRRHSARTFSSRKLSPQMLSDLLWAAFGINRPDSGLRTAPSARNWRDIDIYVCTSQGVYVYDAEKLLLRQVMKKDIREHTGIQDFTQKAPVDLVYVSDTDRMRGADKASKIFYSAADTGFISQNVYLFCAANGLNTVVLGYVDKPALARAMNLKTSQIIILSQPVGYPVR